MLDDISDVVDIKVEDWCQGMYLFDVSTGLFEYLILKWKMTWLFFLEDEILFKKSTGEF